MKCALQLKESPPALKNKKSKAGLTLVEVMISTFVLAVLLTSVFSVLGVGLNVVENFRDRSRIAQIMQNRVETLRAYRWDVFLETSGEKTLYFDSELIRIGNSKVDPPYGWDSFRMEEVIRARDGKPGQYEMVLTAFWEPSGNTEKSYRMVSYFYEAGLNKYYTRSLD